jgi:hypothetical protein
MTQWQQNSRSKTLANVNDAEECKAMHVTYSSYRDMTS